MTVLQGAFWISDQKHRKYLNAGADSVVRGTAPGPRGLDLLNSTSPRTRIWLIEKATDGKNFRFRNYETDTALDIKDQSSNEGAQIVVTGGDGESQVWEVNWLEGGALGGIYQIKNTVTSTVLDQTSDYLATSWQSHGGPNQAWLIEPVLLPTLYRLTNLAASTLVLRASDRPNARDDTSRGVALVSKDLSARNQLWTFEYTSVDGTILRNVSHDQFVLDLSVQASQTLLARKYHGGVSQRWVVNDEDENKHIVSITNMKTNLLLATRTQQLPGIGNLYVLAAAIEGNTRWKIDPSPQPPFFWVTIQNSKTGAFLAQSADGSINPSIGALNANDHSVQWRFILLGKEPRYLIVNRATGFMLEHHDRTTSGVSIVAESNDRNDINRQWTLGSVGDTNVGIVNIGSMCALDHYCGGAIQAYQPGFEGSEHRHWVITPCYDTLPSFALVNSRSGRCIANNPDPDVGTVITTDDVNNFQSHWLFCHFDGSEATSGYALLNKMSGNVLEYYHGTGRSSGVEAHDNSYTKPNQKWKLLPLRKRGFALSTDSSSYYFLCDPSEYDPTTGASPLEGSQVPSWQLISHRESGFDFISLDFDILQRLLPHIPSQPAARALQEVISYRRPASENKKKGNDKRAFIPRATRITRTTNDTLRVILTRLIGQWEEDSIPEASQPRAIVSTNRGKVEQEWRIPLSERPLRRRSDEAEWIRIDLKGMHNIDGSWVADIQGQWLEVPVFQIIIPVGIHVGRAVIQRAMLQSLAQGLTVEIWVTMHTATAGKVGRPGFIDRYPNSDWRASNGKQNSLALTLDLITIKSLKHDEL